ncbi:hypothetical protein TNCV_4472771 [Trichonephila clavipes]|uniref:Uncharacterized protein n=1 Tax=Trichonephila clavipes TaxID=2585209 RepID=A0A8X6SD11_TRICX|nr:hypothetical protein TNCV_4472771 [Trichonephila clavipes]
MVENHINQAMLPFLKVEMLVTSTTCRRRDRFENGERKYCRKINPKLLSNGPFKRFGYEEAAFQLRERSYYPYGLNVIWKGESVLLTFKQKSEDSLYIPNFDKSIDNSNNIGLARISRAKT